jgi:pimeloyl-ACP methyl ester carboxylesterase
MRASSFSVVVAVWLAAGPAVAQDRPVVFVHGLLGSSGTWYSTSQTLAQQLQIVPLPPTLGWQYNYEDQATTLDGYLGGYGVTNVVAVSHSNGGIVTRQYGRTHPTGSRITGHVAVASLHRGALLAQNVRDGTVFNYVGTLAADLGIPMTYFVLNDPWFHGIVEEGLWIGIILLNTAAAISDNYAEGVASLGYPIPTLGNPAVLDEMGPNTPFMHNDLNTEGSLAAEASAFQQRISMSTTVPATDVVARTWCGSLCSTGTREGFAWAALTLFAIYLDSDDPVLSAAAGLWLPFVNDMAAFDDQWLFFIGAYDGVNYSPQDGVLPVETSTYVNGTDPHIQLVGNISHLEQPTNPVVIGALSDVLRQRFGIPNRPPPPPPPPPDLSVDLSGPTLMGPNDVCWFYATAHDGTPPYTFAWSTGFVETTDGTSHVASGGPVYITVSVTDAVGGQADAGLGADVDENSYGCN